MKRIIDIKNTISTDEIDDFINQFKTLNTGDKKAFEITERLHYDYLKASYWSRKLGDRLPPIVYEILEKHSN